MKLILGRHSIKVSTIIIVLFISIIMSGATVFSFVRNPRIWLCGLIGVFYIVRHGYSYVFHSLLGKLYIVWLLFLIVNSYFSYYTTSSVAALIIFASFFAFMGYDLDLDDLLFISKLIKIISMIFALSIIVNAMIPNLFYGPLSGLVAQSPSVIQSEVSKGAYSGIIGEKAQAAFYMNIAIVFYIGEIIYKKSSYNFKNTIPLLIFLLALLLTGKRMLLLVAVCVIAFSFVYMGLKKKSTIISLFIAIGIAVPIMLLCIQLVPQAQVVFERFEEYTGDDTYNGRTIFWQFCLYMFNQHPLIGFGFDSFNKALGDLSSFTYNGEKWGMYAHSLYYELLGETGIIGVAIFFSIILCSLMKSWRYYKYFKVCEDICDSDKLKINMLLFISISIQIIFCLYGITGNVLYDHCQLGFLILSFVYTMTVERCYYTLAIRKLE